MSYPPIPCKGKVEFYPTCTQIAEEILRNPQNWHFPNDTSRGLEFRCNVCKNWHDSKFYGFRCEVSKKQ